jgi:hypothetical protein
MLHTILVLISILCTDAFSVKLIPETGTPPAPRLLPGITSDISGKSLYIYGGVSEYKFSDMWKFDLENNRWTQIYTGSVLTPGLRSSPFMTTLNIQSKLLLFGGDTPSGPVSDVWLYDIEGESVILIQWKLVDDKGRAPPRAFYRSICQYYHEGKQYMAVYGGRDREKYIHSLFMYDLYRLDLETFTWEEIELSGPTPDTSNKRIAYYKGSLYMIHEGKLIKFELSSGIVSYIDVSKSIPDIWDYGLCVYGDYLYSSFGISQQAYNHIIRINLRSREYITEEITIEEGPGWAFGYTCRDNIMSFFAGNSYQGFKNYLWSYDLDNYDIRITTLSKNMNIAPARKGHSMEVFDNKLFMFGGVNAAGKR